MDISPTDILVMKKQHPCGEKRMLVLRAGMDFKLKCLGCGHEFMAPRNRKKCKIGGTFRKRRTLADRHLLKNTDFERSVCCGILS